MESDVPSDGQACHPRDIQRVKNIALHRLGRSSQTRQQLTDAARKKDIPTPAIDAALDELTDLGLIDDVAYAERYVESRRNSRGLSVRALHQELARKGIPTDLAQAATEDITSDDDANLALAYALRKAPSLRGVPEDKAIRRLVGQLARRGHNPAVAFQVARQALTQPN